MEALSTTGSNHLEVGWVGLNHLYTSGWQLPLKNEDCIYF
jgi:hypothetical protein